MESLRTLRKNYVTALFAVISLFSIATELPGQDNIPTPTTLEELRKEVANKMGGSFHLESIRSIRFDGKLTNSEKTVKIRIVKKRPNLSRIQIQDETTDLTLVTAYNREIVWSYVTQGNREGARLLEAEEEREFIANSRFYIPLLDKDARGIKIEFAGLEEFQGEKYYRVNVYRNQARDTASFFHPEDFLEIYSASLNEDGSITTYVKLEDYRENNKLWIPYKQTTYMDGKVVSTITVDEVNLDVGIFDMYFNPPPAAQALLDRKKEEETTP